MGRASLADRIHHALWPLFFRLFRPTLRSLASDVAWEMWEAADETCGETSTEGYARIKAMLDRRFGKEGS